MDWNKIFSHKRYGDSSTQQGPRTDFQRDYDRIIFSSGFRRLQNKTQVFPLPGATFVHNRLTHSLEVASVGRSLGMIVGRELCKLFEKEFTEEALEFYRYDLQNVIASACLAHDIGNPAFGHSGEKAISNYFRENEKTPVEKGRKLKKYFSGGEWEDLLHFEGNANALRVLTHQFKGKSPGGYRLTLTTLGAILKYPTESTGMKEKSLHRKKYGFFQSERDTALEIFQALNMIQEKAKPLVYKRHPFVYLTEAADDICYRIMDLEDAQRLGIINTKETEEYFLNLIDQVPCGGVDINRVKKMTDRIVDNNEKISYLRANSINVLTQTAAKLFIQKAPELLEGRGNQELVDLIEDQSHALKDIKTVSEKKIYNHNTVMQIEIAGYNVMYDLLNLFVPAVLKEEKTHKDKKVIGLIPGQFRPIKDPEKDPYTGTTSTSYERVFSVLDYISGMTDPYATELYRKAYGIEIPKHG